MPNSEQAIKLIPIGADLPAELAKIEKEGWKVIPGCQPFAVYPVFRTCAEAMPVMGVEVESNLIIDDTKVHIVRNGEIVG